MRLNLLMATKAIICLIVGIALVLIPTTVVAWFGVTLDAAGTYVARLFGSAFLVLAVLLWTVRSVTNEETQNDIVVAVFAGDAIGLIVSLFHQLSNTVNSLGWLIVAVYLLLTLGFGYFLVARHINPFRTHQPAGS